MTLSSVSAEAKEILYEHEYLLPQIARGKYLSDEVHMFCFGVHPWIVQFDDVFVFQCLQQVNFWLKVLQIFRTLQNISNFHLIPCHFNSIHFIKCPVAAKELRANHNMTKADPAKVIMM